MKKILLIVSMLLICLSMFADLTEDIENDERLTEISSLFQTGQPDQEKLGFEKLDKIIEKTPQYEAALYIRALLLVLKTDNLDAAIKDMKVISEIRENSVSIYIEIISVYINGQKYDRAKKVVDVALSLFPESEDVYLFYGIIESTIGDPEKAIEYLHKALEIKPDIKHGLSILKSVYSDECKKSEVDHFQRSKYFAEIAGIYRTLQNEEEMIKAAYYAKAFGNDSALT